MVMSVLGKYKFTLDESAKEYAKEHLREDELEYDAKIQEIKEWLNSEPQLHAREDETNIIRFLRGGKFDIERTKKKIKQFYSFKATTPEWYSNRDPTRPELQELLNLGVFVPLLKKDPFGRLVVIIRGAIHDPKIHQQEDIFKISNMTLELAAVRDESISIYGVMAIIDLKGVKLAHARQMTPRIIKRAVYSWQNCYPLLPKGFDFINAPIYVNVLLNMFRKILSNKLRERALMALENQGIKSTYVALLKHTYYSKSTASIRLHNGSKIFRAKKGVRQGDSISTKLFPTALEKGFKRLDWNKVVVHGSSQLGELHKKIPPDILPEEYGGTNGKIQDLIDYWKTEVTIAKTWYLDDDKYKAEL